MSERDESLFRTGQSLDWGAIRSETRQIETNV